MLTRKKCFAVLLLLYFFSISAYAQGGFVHTSGVNLVDAGGHVLMLRGTNFGNWLEPEGYMFHFEGGA